MLTSTSSKSNCNFDTEWDPKVLFQKLGIRDTVRFGKGSWLPTATDGGCFISHNEWRYTFSEDSSHKLILNEKMKNNKNILFRITSKAMRYFAYLKLKRAIKKQLYLIHPFWNHHVEIVIRKGENYLYINVTGSDDAGKHIEQEFKDKSILNKEISKQMLAYIKTVS